MKEFKYFLDSNIFLRPIVKDDLGKLKECEVLFEKIKQGQIQSVTSNIVLAEIVWVCQSVYGLNRQLIARAIKGILHLNNLKIRENFRLSLALEIYETHSIKFIDALIASHPQIQNQEMIVVSYDRDFDKLKIIRKEPKEIIKNFYENY